MLKLINRYPPLWLIAILLLVSCSGEQGQTDQDDTQFSDYISGYTSGVIRSDAEISIHFNVAVPDSMRNNSSNLFDFSPSIPGQTVWLNDYLVTFKPEERLQLATSYQATFYLAKLMSVPENLGPFTFDFRTVEQDMELQNLTLRPVTNIADKLVLNGELVTADIANFNHIKTTLQATQQGKELDINWQESDSPVIYTFTVADIQQFDGESEVVLQWNGDPIDADTDGRKIVDIAPAGTFKVMNARFVHGNNPHITITFSDIISQEQNLLGLIRLGKRNISRFQVINNEINIYPRKYEPIEQELTIDASLKNSNGIALISDYTKTMTLARIKPQVSFSGSKVIIPQADDQLLLPFRAVGLSGVDIRVSRIYRKNIIQFLQVNNMAGDYQMRRVGEVIAHTHKALSIKDKKKLLEWNDYSLDLSEIINPQPGHIYRIDIAFREHQSLYPCGEETDNEEAITGVTATSTPYSDPSYWDRFTNYYYNRGGYSNWKERNNPCNSAYYGFRKSASRNVLASNLGIIAKHSKDGDFVAAISNLLTTEPERGITVKIFNYQQRKLAEKETNSEGLARFKLNDEPFMLIAESGQERGYLKLEDGNVLSTSSFNVTGNAVDRNLKGFMYGERGVWRPGDSLFVTLMVEDKSNRLPDDHPVVFELVNPRGQQVDRKVITDSKNGFYVYRSATDQKDPTGNWYLTARVGGTSFRKKLKVETVRPNRLKLNLSFEDSILTGLKTKIRGNISAQWLHGATADGLKADINMNMNATNSTLPNYSTFSFKNLLYETQSEPIELFTGTLDETGTAAFTYAMDMSERTPQAINLNLKSRVFEESGNFSVQQSTKAYYPFGSLVGLEAPEGDDYGRLASDTTHQFRVVTLKPDGTPNPSEEVSVTFYKIEWRWWWERSSQKFSNFIERYNKKGRYKATVQTNSDGVGRFSINMDSNNWGRYLVVVEDKKHGASMQELVRFKWSGRYGRQQSGGAPARLSLDTDREDYQPGDRAQITFPSFPNGRALVSLESNNSVLDSYWIETDASSTTRPVEITEEMAPNIYLHVVTVQPHEQKSNDRPMRMYGMIPIMVEDPATRLNPKLDMADELQPEQDFTIEISEENGKALSYTVAMVDEGLLDLTNYTTPEPWRHFYAKEALGVDTWDLYDEVASPYAGSINRILSVGGDGVAQGERPDAKIVRFKPVVKFMGPYTLDPGSVNSHTLRMPHYIGSVKTMVVAGNKGAYGHTSATTPVRKPLMVLGTAPRTLSPKEKMDIPVSVFNMQQKQVEVTVRITTNELFTQSGKESKTISVPAMSDKLVRFPVSVASTTGKGAISVFADNGTHQASYPIELEVKNPNPPIAEIKQKLLEPGEQWSTSLKSIGQSSGGDMVLELSTIPALNLESRLEYLMDYPHGCLEQTTSRAFPQLYLNQLMDLSTEQQQNIQDNVAAAIERIKDYQLTNGGFSYWPGAMSTNAWSTNYTVHFLTEAREQGYFVPDDLYNSAIRYVKTMANSWSHQPNRRYSDLIQTYRLYNLALAGEPDMGAMNRLRTKSFLTVAAKWRLAAAYTLVGQKQAAEDLVDQSTTQVDQYRELSNTFGSSFRDRAMILEALVLMDRQETGFRVMRELAQTLGDEDWLSTQEIGFGLMAVAKYASSGSKSDSWSAVYRFGSQSSDIRVNKPLYQKQLLTQGDQSKSLMVQNTSGQAVFAQVINRGKPVGAYTKSSALNLEQKITYLNLNGDPVSVDHMEQGDDLIMEVTVTHPGISGVYRELALSQIMPSGWEISNSRMDNVEFTEPSSSYTYQDIRDDRVLTYFNLHPGNSKTFRVMVNASYAGRYLLPSTKTAAMYDETIQATSSGRWVKILEPN